MIRADLPSLTDLCAFTDEETP